MVYERYVMKNGKLHGPYYYESYRDEHGNVKKRYFGHELGKNDSAKHLYYFLFAVCFMIIAVIIVSFFYEGSIIRETAFKMKDIIDKGFTGLVIGDRGREIQGTQTIDICRGLNDSNTVYQLTANVESNGTCFNLWADNVTLDCQGRMINYSLQAVGLGFGINITGNNSVVKRCSVYEGGMGNSNSYGLYLESSTGANISDVFVRTFSSNSYGVYYNFASFSNLTNVSVETSGTSATGLYYNFAENNTFKNGKVSVADSGSWGVYLMNINRNSVINSNITMNNGGQAVYLSGASSNTIANNSISSIGGFMDAVYIAGDSDYNFIDNNTIYSSGDDGIDVRSSGVSYPTLNNISRNAFNSGSITNYDIYISGDDSFGGTWLIDQVGKTNDYYFSNANLVVKESVYGQINWVMSLTETGGNLSQNISIANNSALIRSVSTMGMNQSANVTFFNFGDRGYTDPGILRDGSACVGCTNFTALTASTVIFNVTGWSNYSIGSSLALGEVNTCQNLTSANINYKLVNDVSSTGTCFIVGGDNILFNCAGKKISYGTNGLSYAFDNYYKYKNFSVINCIIEQVNGSQGSSHAIYLYYSGNNTIYNNTIITNGSGSRGVWLDATNNANISSNRINTTTGEGVYLGPGSSNMIKDNQFFASDGNAISLFGDSDYNTIKNNIIKTNWSGIYLITGLGGYPNMNNVSGNTFKGNVGGVYYDIYLSSDCSPSSYDGTWLIDQIGNINSYYISSSCFVVQDSTHGMIKWYSSISPTGINLSSEIVIINNSIVVNGSNSQFNFPANVTLFNFGERGINYSTILRDGSICYLCANFTSLTASTVIFNVTGWSNYSIGRGLAPGEVGICQNLTSANSSYTLANDVGANSTCFIVGGENINFNCAGKKISYSMNGSFGYGFNNFNQYKNFSVVNCIIEQVNGSQTSSHAIYLDFSNNSLVYNNTIVVNGSGSSGVWADYSNNLNISSNRINTTTGEGVYLSVSSSNVIKDNEFYLSNGNAISFSGDSDCNIVKNNIIKTNSSGVYLSASGGLTPTYPNLNNISGNTFKSDSPLSKDITVSGGDCNSGNNDGTWLIDQIGNINDYSFYSSCLVVVDSVYGMIRWHSAISPIASLTGINLSSEIVIINNSVVVNGSNTYLTGPANVTLFNFGDRNYTDIGILRNGFNCMNCYNFTSLNASTVIFNVTGWSNYSIGEWDLKPPGVTIHSPRNITYYSSTINFTVELSENGSAEFNLDDNIMNYSMENPNSNNRNFSYLHLSMTNGWHTIKIYANDTSNNKNQTENVTFRVSIGGSSESSSGSSQSVDSSALPTLPLMTMCVPQYLCIPTGACINGFRTKECFDNMCGSGSFPITEPCNVELCVPEWECSGWSVCENGVAKRACNDIKKCTSNDGMPNTMLECAVLPEKKAEELACKPNFACGEWGGCIYTDKIEDLLQGKIKMLGQQERACNDLNNCAGSYTDTKPCTSEKSMIIEKEKAGAEEKKEEAKAGEAVGAVGGGMGRLVAKDPKTNKPLMHISLDAWKKKGLLEIKFVQ